MIELLLKPDDPIFSEGVTVSFFRRPSPPPVLPPTPAPTDSKEESTDTKPI